MSEEEKNHENKIIIEQKEDFQRSELTLLTLDEYNKQNRLTKFTPKSNKKWRFFQPKNNNINKEEQGKNKESKKLIEKENNSKILEKWKELQKSIKETLSLEELMIEKQMQDNSQLKEKFKEYYGVKLKCRKEYETINNLESGKQKEKEYIISDNIERELLDTCEPIKNLLFLMRNRPDYIVKIKNLIKEDKDEVNSLVELLCNQFYDNILIPSQNQNNPELSNLIYKLLEDEIISMNSATVEDFLNNNSFLGKFLTTYVKKDEFRLFFGKLLKPLILSIDNQDDDCLDLSIINIKSKLNKKEREKEKEKEKSVSNKINIKEDEFDFKNLYKDIKRTTIVFKKNKDLDDDVKKDEEKNNIKNDENENNPEYFVELTQDVLISKIRNEKDKDMKDFYIYQLEQINSDPEIFTNNGLKNILNEYSKESKDILNKYKQNFIFIKQLIDSLLQELIDKINIIPYSLKCICKIIYILISKKFPKLPKFYRNSFIGKFFFDKCIFPILSLDSKNAIINRIFSSYVKNCLNVIINVLSSSNRGILYQANSDTEKTIFNYYLIELIPILNKFYEQLIDIKLPSFIDEYLKTIDNQIEDNIENKIFHFQRKKNPNKINDSEKLNNMIKNNNKNYEYVYNYFNENPEEIMRLQGICFSASDVLFIIKLISNNYKTFENLPEYDFFIKTIERINTDDYKLDELSKSNANNQVFYIIFRDERNNQIEKIFKSKKKNIKAFSSDENSEKD